MIRRAKIDQLRYTWPKHVIQRELDERFIKRNTEIWIYPTYPAGYMAVVGAFKDLVYIFEAEWGLVVSMEVRRCLGVRPNGSLIYNLDSPL